MEVNSKLQEIYDERRRREKGEAARDEKQFLFFKFKMSSTNLNYKIK